MNVVGSHSITKQRFTPLILISRHNFVKSKGTLLLTHSSTEHSIGLYLKCISSATCNFKLLKNVFAILFEEAFMQNNLSVYPLLQEL